MSLLSPFSCRLTLITLPISIRDHFHFSTELFDPSFASAITVDPCYWCYFCGIFYLAVLPKVALFRCESFGGVCKNTWIASSYDSMQVLSMDSAECPVLAVGKCSSGFTWVNIFEAKSNLYSVLAGVGFSLCAVLTLIDSLTWLYKVKISSSCLLLQRMVYDYKEQRTVIH